MEKFKWGVFAAAMALAAVMILHPAGWTHAQYTPPSGGSGGTCAGLGGDVTGTCAASTVVKLQNRALASTAPSDTNTICWSASGSTWKPCAAAGGGSAITQGTYASLPATCTTGDVYFPTNSLIDKLRCSSTNTWSAFVSPFVGLATPPVIGNFTAVNTGTSTIDSTRGGVRYTTTSMDAAMNAHIQVKSAPATPYHVITCFAIQNASGVTNSQIGMVFREAGTGKLVFWGTFQNSGNTYVAFYLSSPTAFGGSTPVNSTALPWATAPVGPGNLCLRIGDDGTTNRTYDISTDGRITWTNVGSEARNSQFVADQVGFGVNGGASQEAWFLDYEETP